MEGDLLNQPPEPAKKQLLLDYHNDFRKRLIHRKKTAANAAEFAVTGYERPTRYGGRQP